MPIDLGKRPANWLARKRIMTEYDHELVYKLHRELMQQIEEIRSITFKDRITKRDFVTTISEINLKSARLIKKIFLPVFFTDAYYELVLQNPNIPTYEIACRIMAHGLNLSQKTGYKTVKRFIYNKA